jgi:IrrE N-terminal-like domain
LAKNFSIKQRTANDIDSRVERVLRGLGQPEPPLRLEEVRELLKLDRQFYTADDPSLVREVVSRIRVATIQVMQRPTLLIDAIRKLSLQALYIPDRKRILLDGSLPEKKHRWSEAHEIGHSLLPWHEDVMFGDNRYTLLPHCQEEIEAEANYAAGRLLFLRGLFEAQALAAAPTIATIQSLKGVFGNTISSTLWRFVEVAGRERPMVGMITCHPHVIRRPADFNPVAPCRHCIQSPAFAAHFSRISEAELFEAISQYCNAKRGGDLGSEEVILRDDNGGEHIFLFESFFIRYKPPGIGEALTLGIYKQPKFVAVAV